MNWAVIVIQFCVYELKLVACLFFFVDFEVVKVQSLTEFLSGDVLF